MESSLDQIAAQCSAQLANYQRCILLHHPDPTPCAAAKTELSRCASSAVPLLASIKSMCAAQVVAYDRCLARHTADGDEQLEKHCTPLLRDLWRCSDRAKRALENQEAEKQSAGQAERERERATRVMSLTSDGA
ncbi:hypothetical protein ACQY0O_005337 [Thecaphora frezii]